MPIVGVRSTSSMYASGTLPPLLGRFTIGPNTRSKLRITHCETGKSIDVRTALYAFSDVFNIATFGCFIRVASSGSRSVTK